MSSQKFESSVILKHNGHEIIRLSCPFSYEEIESEISKLIKNDVPVLCVIHGMPGIGKSYLGSLISEKILHCVIIDFDAFCRTGSNCILKADSSYINQSMRLVFQIYSQFACNVIYTTSAPKDSVLEDAVPKFYDLIVIEFEKLDSDFGAFKNINGLDKHRIDKMLSVWEQYDIKRRRKDA